MKRKLQINIYFFLLLLSGFFASANANQKVVSHFSYKKDTSHVTLTKEFSKINSVVFNQENSNDKIEIAESDFEEEEVVLASNLENFNFFLAYFDTKICANHSLFIQNRLAPCKHIEFLSTLSSRHILLCVYRL